MIDQTALSESYRTIPRLVERVKNLVIFNVKTFYQLYGV